MARTRRKKTKKSRISFLRVLLVTSVLLFTAGAATIITGYFYFSKELPDLVDITNYNPELVNEIYASDGRLVARFGLQKRMLVDPDDIQQHVKDAFIAVEDRRFFDHSGIDLVGILRATVENIRRGSFVAGGSTITQQVTKNLILTPERTITRKIKEAILAYQIENNLSKEEILYLYLNHIYLADGTYGIESASNNYFGKSSEEINIAEAALLASIPRLPEYYSPRRNLKRALNRQKLVLSLMKDNGFITESQYREALEYEIEIVPSQNINFQTGPYFIEYVRQHLLNKVGSENYARGGYKVITTMDVDLNLAAHWAVRRGLYDYDRRRGRGFVVRKLPNEQEIQTFISGNRGVSPSAGNFYQGVVVSTKAYTGDIMIADIKIGKFSSSFRYAVSSPFGSPVSGLDFPLSDKFAPLNGYKDVHIIPEKLQPGDVINVKVLSVYRDYITLRPAHMPAAQASLFSMDNHGNVVAMVGGHNFLDTQFNRAVQAQRQPGSAFKPLVYSAALDKGYTGTSILFDIPLVIDDWEPRNYDGEYDGPMILREAIARSRNLATIRMTMDIDPAYVASYASRFGFSSTLNPYPSIALGGSDVSLMEMVKAFHVFANEGRWIEPRFIVRIYDRNGAVIEDNTDQEFIHIEHLLKEERETRRKQVLEMIARKRGRVPESTGEEFIEEKDFADEKPSYRHDSYLTPDEFINLLAEHSIVFNPSNRPLSILSPETAYIVTDLLQTVVKEGTGTRASRLNRLAPVAGKTGTTNDYTDAWFVGYSPTVTTGVWMGRDDSRPLGNQETGARAALPVWMNYMEYTLSDRRFRGGNFIPPPGIKIVNTPYGEIPYRRDSLMSGVIQDIESQTVRSQPESVDDVLEGLKKRRQQPGEEREFEDEAEIDFLLRR